MGMTGANQGVTCLLAASDTSPKSCEAKKICFKAGVLKFLLNSL